MRRWQLIAEGLAEFLWPQPTPCPGCGRPGRRLTGRDEFCPACRGRLPLVVSPFCRRCGKPLRLGAAQKAECRDCVGVERAFRVARASGLYDGELRCLIHRYKFRSQRELAGPLSRLLAGVWMTEPLLRQASILVPVPLGVDRLAERGFNQAEDLARALGEKIGRPVAAEALLRLPGQVQSLRSERTRRVAARQAFQVLRPGSVAERRVLLVDDVFTTGATAESCAEALLRAGAATVDVLTVATTVLPASWVGDPVGTDSSEEGW